MERVQQKPDGTYSWSCRIDKEFHREAAMKGVYGYLIVILVVLVIGVFFSFHFRDFDWIPVLICIGVISAIALPLLYFSVSASDPHEQYVMTQEYVKTGYGRNAVFSDFGKARTLVITSAYIEIADDRKKNRIHRTWRGAFRADLPAVPYASGSGCRWNHDKNGTVAR